MLSSCSTESEDKDYVRAAPVIPSPTAKERVLFFYAQFTSGEQTQIADKQLVLVMGGRAHAVVPPAEATGGWSDRRDSNPRPTGS